jgi:hypothetical protein
MADFHVKFDVRGLTGLTDAILSAVMDGVADALETTAQQTATTWQASVMGVPDIWLGKKKEMAESIQWQMLTPLKAEVFSDSPLAEQFENGFPAYDMKQMLNTSDRTRMSKNGIKYLIIPFRHNTPGNSAHAGAMPDDVYGIAKGLAASSVTSQGSRLSATGKSVPQSNYKWGGRLAAGMAPKNSAAHSTDIYAGMVRFDTSSGKQKSSAYLTFRVMTANQTGKWLIAAKPGKGIARNVAKAVDEILAMNMNKALQNVVTV